MHWRSVLVATLLSRKAAAGFRMAHEAHADARATVGAIVDVRSLNGLLDDQDVTMQKEAAAGLKVPVSV